MSPPDVGRMDGIGKEIDRLLRAQRDRERVLPSQPAAAADRETVHSEPNFSEYRSAACMAILSRTGRAANAEMSRRLPKCTRCRI